jgi:hypothetical protein
VTVRSALFLVLVPFLAGCRTACLGPCEHDHDEPERPPPLCADLCVGWCDPVDHAHASRRGTPYVHAFHVEPAFLGRDVLLHVEREGDEHGVEAELEWALTRRLLLVAEVPYAWTEDEDGFGDVALGLRGLLLETDRLIVSAQVGVELPTASGGLGADEVVVSPGFSAWADLGGRFSAQAGVNFGYATESGDTEVSWGAALVKSFPFCPLFRSCAGTHAEEEHGQEEHAHGHGTFLSLFLEGRGVYPLSGPEEGASTHELLLGVSVPVAADFDLRVGWTLLWDDEADAASGWVAGFVLHL